MLTIAVLVWQSYHDKSLVLVIIGDNIARSFMAEVPVLLVM